MRCAMTGRAIHDSSQGIWEDGEWISWDWINQQLYEQELQETYPAADPRIAQIFDDLVLAAKEYHELTGRYLQVWGELGELYAEIKFGLRRHAPGVQGSDGRIGNDWVEVKTISPENGKEKVCVKRAGNFNKLLIVRISPDFEIEAKWVDRKKLHKGPGKKATVSWKST